MTLTSRQFRKTEHPTPHSEPQHFPMNTSHDDDRAPWSEPDEPPSFLAARSIKRQLLEELSEPSGGPSNADLADLLGRWPTDATKDPDVAGLLFQDFRNRSVRGDPVSRAKYEEDFPEHRDSLENLLRRQDFLRSVTSISEPSAPTLALPKIGDELFGYRLREQLGQGAFARVFLAEQSELADRRVALKTSDLSGSEPQTLAQLQHTNIVPIYSVHEDVSAGIRAVCMPYFGGASLSQVLHAFWKTSSHPTSGAEIVEAIQSFAPTDVTERVSGSALAAGTARGHDTTRPATTPVASDIPLTENAGRLTPVARIARLNFPSACAWIIARLADGLQHAHDRGVLYRDIKPGNILLGADGTPMLLDFNLSHDENQSHAQVEATLGGTVAYMAPEHLRALSRRTAELVALVDERSDLYGLGMVLFEMITGHNPFESSISYAPVPILVEAMATERSRSIPSLRQFREDVPWGLESIVRKCLQPDATTRYQHASELAEDLDRWLEDRPLRHAPELSRVEQFQKWTRRHPQLAMSGLISTAAVSLLTFGWLMLLGTQARLSAAQARVVETEGSEARELQRRFEQGTLKALCLLNTHSDLHDHAEQGRQVCEETLALFDILDDPNWQDRAAWKRLSATEQTKLSEDARELLLLLAGADLKSQISNLKSQISNLKSQIPNGHFRSQISNLPARPRCRDPRPPTVRRCLAHTSLTAAATRRNRPSRRRRPEGQRDPSNIRARFLSAGNHASAKRRGQPLHAGDSRTARSVATRSATLLVVDAKRSVSSRTRRTATRAGGLRSLRRRVARIRLGLLQSRLYAGSTRPEGRGHCRLLGRAGP